MFELPEPTRAKIKHVNVRTETHGEDRKPAVTIKLRIEASNMLLQHFEDDLPRRFYRAPALPPAQAVLDGTMHTQLTELLSQVVAAVLIKGVYQGWTLFIDYGASASSHILMGGCKVDKIKAELLAGGTIALTLNVGSSDIDDRSLGRICMLQDIEVSITLKAPKAGAAQSDIDEEQPVKKPRGRPRKVVAALAGADV